MNPLLFLFIILMALLGLAACAFLSVYRPITLVFKRVPAEEAPARAIEWRVKNLNKAVATIAYTDKLAKLTFGWAKYSETFERVSHASQYFIRELGHEIIVPHWWPNWLPPKKNYSERHVLMKRSRYRELTKLVEKQGTTA